jgi:hypothetical protein
MYTYRNLFARRQTGLIWLKIGAKERDIVNTVMNIPVE